MRREISFVKVSPTQNMTILVRSSHEEDEYAPIALKMMSYDNVYAEQVGFIKESRLPDADAALRMAGGEFCGNACMALAVLMAHQQTSTSDSRSVKLEASGTDQLIQCMVTNTNEGYCCKVMMPAPRSIEAKIFKYDGNQFMVGLIQYSDFLHVVLEVERFTKPVKKMAQSLAKLLEITSTHQLIGILLYKPSSGELLPLIHIPVLDSMVWERGCGSGTASIGAYMAWKNKTPFEGAILQPGGLIKVSADLDKSELTGISISGNVSIVAEGTAYIDL
ncbi:diaminopimelate epimerase [Paenibacillus rhizoplanae]|uniref:Diaminopimelate epimerase n=1 Tax=Paenibacillus rhizoplanae TaxID=1917181 RepID=A0ABW5FF02_9BACL